MRDLSMQEIEVVSGAGWFDWVGGITEQVQQWITAIGQLLPGGMPVPNTAQQEFIDKNCPNGLASAQFIQEGNSITLSFSAANGANLNLVIGGGTFAPECLPPPSGGGGGGGGSGGGFGGGNHH